ncbi:class I SAM-dependent methyltransferase [Candidatus Kaiserbacteria bacterium]|nr:class I SAM-dependent methyltransferase [Candidatus Kaiserbacteria bacterium]
MNAVMARCRSCDGSSLQPILSLGKTPLANALLTEKSLHEPEETYPLDLVFCPQCTLVQITETVPPEKLFSEYLYFSSFSDTVLESAHTLAERLIAERSLDTDSTVLEIASNDGYLLKNYKERGIKVIGVEPARNIANMAEKAGIPTIAKFFASELARELVDEGKRADVIHAHNVIAHVADLHGVVKGIHTLLKPDGVAVIENHYVKDLIDHTEFDSIYHEHLCYYSATSFERLFRRHGLVLVDVERIPVHGGSLRVFFQRADGSRSYEKKGVVRVENMLREEKAWGVDTFDFYKNFGLKIERLRHDLIELLSRLKREGSHIAVYGASAKSTTLLNYFGIGKQIIDYVVDRSTAKQGRFTPGTHLPVFPPEKLAEAKPEYTLLLTWNFADEILAQQKAYREAGGKFIIPIPELRVL